MKNVSTEKKRASEMEALKSFKMAKKQKRLQRLDTAKKHREMKRLRKNLSVHDKTAEIIETGDGLCVSQVVCEAASNLNMRKNETVLEGGIEKIETGDEVFVSENVNAESGEEICNPRERSFVSLHDGGKFE
jgi:hypothetical protein